MDDVKPQVPPLHDGRGPLDSLGFLLSQLGFVSAKRFRDVLAPLHLEPRHFFVLRVIGGNEGRSQQTLGDALRIPPSRMVAVIDDLERQGLVERRSNPGDRRMRALHLTDDGRVMIGRAVRLATDHERGFGSSLTVDERRELIRLLQKVAGEMQLLSGVHPGMTESEQGCPDPPDSAGLRRTDVEGEGRRS